MIWSPLEWSRPAWDLDLHRRFHTDRNSAGAADSRLGVSPSPKGLQRARAWNAGWFSCRRRGSSPRLAKLSARRFRCRVILSAIVILAALFLLPALRVWGLKHSGTTPWNRAGFAAALVYIACAIYAASVALSRACRNSPTRSTSTCNRSARCRCRHRSGIGTAWCARSAASTNCAWISARVRDPSKPVRVAMHARSSIVTIPMPRRIPTSRPPGVCPQVQTVLWFARFPVTRFHKEGSDSRRRNFRHALSANAAGPPRVIHLSRALQSRRKCSVNKVG